MNANTQLESLKLKNYCEMCGAQDSHTISYRLEPAFNPKGQPKTLCQACRIGSAEMLTNHRAELLKAARLAYKHLRHKAETCRNQDWKASDQEIFEALQDALWKFEGK